MINMIMVKYLDLVGQSILSLLNSEELPINNKGKLVIKMNVENKKKLSYFLRSHFKNNLFFGKNTIILHTCEIQNNWRNPIHCDEFNAPKYKIADDSVWIDSSALNSWFDKEFEKLKNEYKNNNNISFILMNDVDSFDVKYAFKQIFNVECFNEKGYNIIEDGNIIFKRTSIFPEYVMNSIKSEFNKNSLMM